MLVVIVLTALTLITLDSRNGRSGPIGTLGRAAHVVVGPIEGAVDDVASPLSDWWHGVSDAGHLKADNRKLHEQIAALQGQQRAAQQAIDENTALKAYLKLASLLQVKNVTGLIVSRDPGNFDPTLTINKGQESGIAVDMPVMAPAGLVGKVIETWHGGSKIRVLTDPSYSVGVQTPSRPGAPATTGIASGQVGSHDLTVTFDPGTKVKVGDPIVTSPLSTSAPPDIPVGTVSSVQVQPGNTGIVATITPYVDLGGLQYGTVLLWVQGQGPAIPTTTTTTTSPTTTTTLSGSATTVPGALTPTTVHG